MKVEILRCWQTDSGINGEYYVYNAIGEKHLVVENSNDIKILYHFTNKPIEECLIEPTSNVKMAVIMASVEYIIQTHKSEIS